MSVDPRLTHLARGNRKSPTVAESMLWADLRSRQLGVKFRRQAWLESRGYRVVRFDDRDVFTERTAVVDAISAALQDP